MPLEQKVLNEISKEIDRIIAINNLLDPSDVIENNLLVVNIKKLEDCASFLKDSFVTTKKPKLILVK